MAFVPTFQAYENLPFGELYRESQVKINLLAGLPYQWINWYSLSVNQLRLGQCRSDKAQREGRRPILHVLSRPKLSAVQRSLQTFGHISFCSRRMMQTSLNYPGLKAAVFPSFLSSHCIPAPIPGLAESFLKFVSANK